MGRAEGSLNEGSGGVAGGGARFVIAPRAAEVISAYTASAGRVDGAPPPAWARERTASEPV